MKRTIQVFAGDDARRVGTLHFDAVGKGCFAAHSKPGVARLLRWSNWAGCWPRPGRSKPKMKPPPISPACVAGARRWVACGRNAP
jgi:hypothetical protein